ncbi:hypothetical protein AB0P36_34905 [Streptomyces flavidovirens]|uniref:hypothetical protein n=1 Tax=Streptomyces flavidovirens TaxID=67298 RepID=UPI0034462097
MDDLAVRLAQRQERPTEPQDARRSVHGPLPDELPMPGPNDPVINTPPAASTGTPADGGETAERPSVWSRRIEVLGTGVGSTVTALAAIVAVFFTVQQGKADIGTTQEGQLAERYTAAVTNLGDQSPDVRLGGIYAMQRIMKDSPTYQPAVVDVLSAYVRTHARSSGKESAGYEGRPEADVHSAFEVLTRRLPQHDDKAEVDLREAYLPHIGLRGPAGPDGTTGSPQLAEATRAARSCATPTSPVPTSARPTWSEQTWRKRT